MEKKLIFLAFILSITVTSLLPAGAAKRPADDESSESIGSSGIAKKAKVAASSLALHHADGNPACIDPRLAIHYAAASGNLDALKALLLTEQRDRVNNHPGGVPPFGTAKPLHLAARNNHPAIIEELLQVPTIKVNKSDINENTPLHEAAKHGHPDCVKALLKADNIEIDSINVYGHTALHDAINTGRIDVVQLLLEAGANVDISQEVEGGRRHKSSPLQWAKWLAERAEAGYSYYKEIKKGCYSEIYRLLIRHKESKLA